MASAVFKKRPTRAGIVLQQSLLSWISKKGGTDSYEAEKLLDRQAERMPSGTALLFHVGECLSLH